MSHLISTTLLKINLYSWEISFFSYLLFNFSPVKTLWRENLNLFGSYFATTFSIRKLWEKTAHPRGLFSDIGRITNRDLSNSNFQN